MARLRHRAPRALLLTAVVAVAAAALLPATPAAAKPGRLCRSADLRYRFMPGLPKDFGVFKLRIRGGKCATAHRVAKRWMKRFEAALSAGHVKLPKNVRGYSFTTLAPTEAQTYRERGRKRGTTITFHYRVPNG